MNTKEFTQKYYINRKKTNNIKWNDVPNKDTIPMWIADMDFKNDERIINALCDFINYGDYGYAKLPKDYYDTYISFHQKRNNITYKQEWIRFTSGAVDAMIQLINALTNDLEAVMINPPIYPQFKQSIQKTHRKVVESNLINTDSYFTFDYKDIENKIKKHNVKLFMLCSPHNPVGRVYKLGELEELFEICKKYNVIVISDEVHSDIIMPDQTFIPSLALKKYQNMIISINAIAKTFSLPIFSHCHLVIPNKKLRDKVDKYQIANHRDTPNSFNCLPSYYCYKYGGEWLDQLNNVIYENYNYVREQLGPQLEMTSLEGSYLLFINLDKYNKDKSAAKYLLEKANIKTNPGEAFGNKYNNWVRLNLGTSLANVKKAVKQIKDIL